MELLAPAGNIVCLHAAVLGGADAVYLGFEKFSARCGAENFSLDKLKEACDYAHLRDVKIYLTVNTLIYNSELLDVGNLCNKALKAGVDAFIVQDVGLFNYLKQKFPYARLHASTQMNVTDSSGLKFAAALGAKRVTLSRELSIGEIESLCEIANNLNVEIECFCHGALCICYSGQCLMSSMIGSRSANRGRCAQPCRLEYSLVDENNKNAAKNKNDSKYLLSPKDLCALDLLPDFVKAGVASVKIEGRMKSPEYVYSVVSAYRKAIDAIKDDNNFNTDELKKDLTQVFSRGFTTAYLEGKRDNSIMSYSRPNNRGVFIGRVKSANNKLCFNSTLSLNDGDLLEVWTNAGKTRFICPDFNLDKKLKDHRNVKKGDRIFRLRDASLMFKDSNLDPKIPVDIKVKIILGQPISIKVIKHMSKTLDHMSNHVGLNSEEIQQDIQQGFSVNVVGDFCEPARTKEITKVEVIVHISRFGGTDFCISNIDVEMDKGVGMSYSALHKIRAKALEKFREKYLDLYKKDSHIKSKKNLLAAQSKNINSYSDQKNKNDDLEICAFVTNPDIARLAKRSGIKSIYVPVLNYKKGSASYAGKIITSKNQTTYPNKLIYALPTISHDLSGHSLELKKNFDLDTFLNNNNKIFVDSISSMYRALKFNHKIEIGPHIPVINNNSVKYCEELSVDVIWLSPELSLQQIKNITSSNPSKIFGIYIVGATELMITEHCQLMSMGTCSEDCSSCPRRYSKNYLKDRMGYNFPVVTDKLGRSHIYNSVCLDLCHVLPDLINAGVTRFMVDTSLMNTEEAAHAFGRVKKSVSLYYSGKSIEKQKNTTTGHIFREVF